MHCLQRAHLRQPPTSRARRCVGALMHVFHSDQRGSLRQPPRFSRRTRRWQGVRGGRREPAFETAQRIAASVMCRRVALACYIGVREEVSRSVAHCKGGRRRRATATAAAARTFTRFDRCADDLRWRANPFPAIYQIRAIDHSRGADRISLSRWRKYFLSHSNPRRIPR